MGVCPTDLPVVHGNAAVVGEAALQHLEGEHLEFGVEGGQSGHSHVLTVAVVQEEDVGLETGEKGNVCILCNSLSH